MSNLPSKLDEIAAHYSACERQQTIYAAAREIESLTTERDRLRKENEQLRQSAEDAWKQVPVSNLREPY